MPPNHPSQSHDFAKCKFLNLEQNSYNTPPPPPAKSWLHRWPYIQSHRSSYLSTMFLVSTSSFSIPRGSFSGTWGELGAPETGLTGGLGVSDSRCEGPKIVGMVFWGSLLLIENGLPKTYSFMNGPKSIKSSEVGIMLQVKEISH